MRIYIAGPMRGYPDNNAKAFDDAHRYLEWSRCGIEGMLVKPEILNPMQMAREEGDDLQNQNPTKEECKKFFLRDMQAIASCDAIYMLKGWEKSIGARAEHAAAVWLQLDIFYQ